MLHKYLPFIFFIASTLVPVPSFSHTLVQPTEIVASTSYEGHYTGLMDVEMGKGKKHDGRPATFVLKKGSLFCDFPKIGKMPGKITIDLPIEVNSDGTIHAKPEAEAGFLKMPLGMKFTLKLETISEAKVMNQELHFVMTVYGQFMGSKRPTTISFSGKMGKN